MNQRQTKFLAEYLKTGNGTQAAIKAGYSKKTARSIALRLLKDKEISEAIKDSQLKVVEQAEINLQTIVDKVYLTAATHNNPFVALRAADMVFKLAGAYITIEQIVDKMDDQAAARLLEKIINKVNNNESKRIEE